VGVTQREIFFKCFYFIKSTKRGRGAGSAVPPENPVIKNRDAKYITPPLNLLMAG